MSSKPRFVGEKVRVSDAFDLRMGKTPSRKNPAYWRDGGHDWVSIADLGSFGKYVGVTKERINDLAISESGIKPAPANTVLMSFKLSLGKTSITTEPVYTNEAIMAFVDKGVYPVDASFMYHQCRAKDWTAGTNTAVMGKTLNKKTLGQAYVHLPALEVQKMIAARLDFIDEQIRASKSSADKLEHLVKSRFVEMFGDPVVNPKGWDVSTIKKTAITYGDGPFGSNLKSADYVLSGVRVIRLGNIMRGEFSEKDQSYVSYEKFESLRKYECIPGEVVIATLGDPILRACIVPDFGVPSIHKADCMYYETNKEMVLPVFAMCAINQPSMLQRALLDSHGQTRARINSTQAGNLPMILPPMDLQQEFADFAAQVDKSGFAS